ncbi:hypothetical protein [Persicitalea jodogahamensis]|uniref:hypothetical protein n=1 Tax=Persicitalea jodogahamensis TaxID=402147 RepID=UPI001E646EBE|nr:hypothetical protein [Persicitalea jodogahamensis]
MVAGFKGFVIQVPSLWVTGMALYPFVFVKNKKPEEKLLHHECIHLQQQLEMGFLLFYIWYFVEYFIRYLHYQDHYRAYRNISFEREAFLHESTPAYLRERRFWAFRAFL